MSASGAHPGSNKTGFSTGRVFDRLEFTPHKRGRNDMKIKLRNHLSCGWAEANRSAMVDTTFNRKKSDGLEIDL